MPRPQKCRRICDEPKSCGFEPIRKKRTSQSVTMTIDEYEVVRLIDLEGLTQERCAMQMDIARTTVAGIYDVARRKIADSIVNEKKLVIEGGCYRICEKRSEGCCGRNCHKGSCHKDRNPEKCKKQHMCNREE